MRRLRELACLPIRFYRRFLSPLKPPTCRFRPTCSAYGLEAIRVHGILKGLLLTAWRILRCNPFTEPGPDPVPPPGRWRGTSLPPAANPKPGQGPQPPESTA